MADVDLRGLHKTYGNKAIVRGLDLHIADGDILCLLGPSGCGKTTTLRMIAGLEAPTAGEIRIGGALVSGDGVFTPPERRQLGMVFQSYAVWPHRTVLDNVTFPLRMAGAPNAEKRAKAALEQVRLHGLEGRYPHELSGGQQQRVAFARAIVAEPRVLLLDEPLSNLDAKLRDEMRDEIRALCKRIGVTVVLVTHDQEEALGLSDNIAVMDHGTIQQIGTPEALYEQPVNGRVARFVGALNELPGVRRGDTVTVDGEVIPAVPTADAPAEGRCILGFRPEQVAIAPWGLRGVVEARLYLGHTVRLRVRVGEQRIIVDGGGGAREGDKVYLVIRGGFILKGET